MFLLKLLLSHPPITQWESLDAVTMEFYFMTMKQNLFQTKQNVSVQLSGKIPMLSSAGQVNVNIMVSVRKKYRKNYR